MSRRQRSIRAKCGHEGCQEWGLYTADTIADARQLSVKYGNGQWRCTRHSRPDEMLSTDQPIKTHDMIVTRMPHGMYWGERGSGFQFGPGFMAFARDFPEGTVLRVTAEIILPEEGSKS